MNNPSGEDSQRRQLFERLKYTLLTSAYDQVDEILQTLVMKENIGLLYQDFFEGCMVDHQGFLVRGGFFSSPFESCSMDYALYNLLGWAPDSFALKHKLRRIHIAGGAGCSENFQIPWGIFRLPNLEELKISHMGLKNLNPLEKNCPSLRILRLDHNELTEVPRDFLKFSRLKILDLSYNHLEGFPSAGHWLRSMESLQLQGNRLEGLPMELSKYSSLRHLDLSMNQIENIDQNFEEVSSMNRLSLAFNRLKAREEAQWEAYFRNNKQQIGLPF
ncbi:MAG: leucine-rich repeat domain-containing protein [Spirochaetaceae bacterium]|jgi:hypothetical protein|nr:leucine-rich repeat domain-containing protein [Spirochaetaceae bacterium]